MKEKSSEITIQFRRPPTQIFDVQTGKTELFTNRLTVRIQPDEGIHLRFIAKIPNHDMQTRPVEMDFHFRDSFGVNAIPDAYQRLLLDALNGDASLFTRSDENRTCLELHRRRSIGVGERICSAIAQLQAAYLGPTLQTICLDLMDDGGFTTAKFLTAVIRILISDNGSSS